MKKYLLMAFVMALTLQSRAQTLTVIRDCTANQFSGFVLTNNTLYGVTLSGGTNNSGSVYKVNMDGSKYSTIKSFSPVVDYFNLYTNADGTKPSAELTISGDMLYGTCSGGGSDGNGTVFKLKTDGSQFTVLKDFTNDVRGTAVQGSSPQSRLILSGNTLYGTVGGPLGGLFKVNTNGTGFAIIKNIKPNGDLILNDGTIYGIDSQTIFSINTNGMNYTAIKTFTNTPDGYYPTGLTLCSNTLYGTTSAGGSMSYGIVFKVNTDGTGYAVLKNLSVDEVGESPQSNLLVIGNTLYGTTYMGGPQAFGTLFKINMDGTGFSVIHNIAGDDGRFPVGNLVASGNIIYGTTAGGGTYDAGTFYDLDLTPIIATIKCSNSILNVSWNAISNHIYQLQFTTNLAAPNWQNLGNQIAATNTSVSASNIIGSNVQNFYRVNLVQ